jgi:FMN-dependent oxidoreductase (nitrilotriacetate monooxygenase family)
MKSNPRQMHLGAMVTGTGHHIAGWRHPDAVSGPQNLELMLHIARTAERGKMDMLFFADGLVSAPDIKAHQVARFEPITLLSALSMVTTHIGLAATANTTYGDPFHIARMFASLDHLSGGRAGWNVVTGSDNRAAANFSKTIHVEHDERYAIAGEFVDVVTGLWDCWEDDAFPMDKASGRYFDPNRMHYLDYVGKYYSVKGPLNISRSPQGRPVIIQAGSSEPGQEFAARTADLVFSPSHSIETGQAYYQRFKARLAKYGRSPDEMLILPALYFILGRTEDEAREQRDLLQEYLVATDPVGELSWRLGHDISGYSLDALVPDLPLANTGQYMAARLLKTARERGLTFRQLFEQFGSGMETETAELLCGTPVQIADMMEEKFLAGTADGFMIQPPFFPDGLDNFVDLVIPILQERGLYRKDYEGVTLRDHLGLKRPVSPWTARRNSSLSA